jgi:hypothetical protein
MIPLLLAALGCQPAPTTPLVDLTPQVAVAPSALDFGEVAVGGDAELVYYVTNAGGAALEVALTLDGDGQSAFALLEGAATVPPDGEAELHVRFTPDTYLPYAANVVLQTNDELQPELTLPLAGVGVAAPLPDLALDARTIDWGDVDAPATQVLTLRNAGTAPLVLGDASLTGSGAFALVTDPSRTTVAPGNSLPIVLRYDPTPAGDAAQLHLPSNDPDEPDAAVVLLGNGGGDFAYPVAIIDCPGTTQPPGYVAMDGYDAYDPAGHTPLTWAWTLAGVPTDPAGQPLSAGQLTSASGPTTTLFTDAVGTYLVDLVVTNALGTRSAPARCRVEAYPSDLVMVELTWDGPRADLDLHLAQADAPLFAEPETACWCSRAPDWGVPGDRDDDPRLNLDDRDGHGPENISIPTPADGGYDLRVHYFDDHGDGDVTATVRVWLQGQLSPAFQDSRLMRRNEVWEIGRVNWPEATVGVRSVANAPAPRRDCFTP